MPRDSDDLDWLYRRDDTPRPSQEETRAMSEAELAELHGLSGDQRPGAGAAAPPPAERRSSHTEPARREPVRPVPPPPPPVDPRRTASRPDRPRRRRHPVRRFLATLGVLLLALVVWLVGVPAYAWTTGNDVDAFPTGDRPAEQPGKLFLLVGSDSREGLSEEEQSRLGTGSVEGARTDTMMLLYLPPGGRPALISVPRDSFVEIPGNGSNKINASYAFGGAPLLTETVEQNTGLRVDGYVEIGFGGFVEVIDAVGGVELCPEEAISDRDSHLEVEAGCQTMDGVTALGYARMRKADARGDLGRVERQREVMAALADKAVTPASVLNPVRYWRLNHAVAQSLTTDPGTGILDAGQLALAMGRIAGGDGLTLTVPIGNPNASTSAGSAVLWDEADAPALFEAIARGDTDAIAQFADR
ncbi:LCP family protein [Auraticoccus monumenti]|uniref:Cell envelope-related function transcriptional attenuator common domain-containing protein n=1 Tax=Auraticoccus monumenti TaxID=675864 RepID=A0A1G6Z1Q6_9ACTN|nr:LCP family protein [Auraticoccus monumenti]SDD95795.1 cell envelope-related function transcriptional attenuator common domain-containing protein [Auraticoccus monumenti]